MLKKSMFLFIQMLMVSGLLLTGCETDNSTEPVTVDENPVSLNKTEGTLSKSSSRGYNILPNPDFENPRLPDYSSAHSLDYWDALTNDCLVISDPPYNQMILLRGSETGGDNLWDGVLSHWLPINSGHTYRLSGYIYKLASDDNAYIDFHAGIGMGGTFANAVGYQYSCNAWTYVSAQTYIPSYVTHIRVRCVRDGASRSNAMFDALKLEQID